MTLSHFLSPHSKAQNALRGIIRALFILVFVSGCAGETPSPATPAATGAVIDTTSILLAQVIFEVDIPAKSPAGQSIYIDILDEVTGLALNPTRYRMEAKGINHFTLKIPILDGSIIKYRYGREGATPMVEYNAAGNQVRYRLLQVKGPLTVNDLISGWRDLPFTGKSGRLTGQILDSKTNSPIPNAMVSAGGVQTFTATDGSYLIEGLPAGVHNVVAYSLDGSYEPFQQGAQVAADMITPTAIHMTPAQLVNVTFVTHAPADSASGIPIRIIGNILSLGNTFADLGGGISSIASRAPLMTLQTDGSYTLTLSLPVGLDLRYKYSAGDGFWNAEHAQDGSFLVRQLIVPNKDVTLSDTIKTWQTKDSAPVSFTVTVPVNTPNNDSISIQFNPFGWTESLPMWPLGNRQWLFVLYSPMQLVSNVGYRYCRNDQCGLADDEKSKGPEATGKSFTPGRVAQNMQDEVTKWAWIANETPPTNIVSAEIKPRGSSFIAGVELQPRYHPSWQPYMSNGFDNIKQLNANWVTLDPAWTATSSNPPVIEAISGKNPYWQDMVQMVVWAQDKDLSVALYPILNYDPSELQWWSSAARDANWWAAWFDRYCSFILQYADLAEQVKSGYLILGDPSIIPSLPKGKLLNGASSNPAVDAEKRWRNLIADVRSHYHGKIAWALAYNGEEITTPPFISDLDEIYILWSAALTTSSTPQPAALAAEMGRLLDQDILKLKEKLNKGILLGINYPAAVGAARGCVKSGTVCIPFDNLTFDFAAPIPPNMDEQTTLYNAVMVALNSRKWIDGIFSRGYYPPAAVQDFTASVHGKPAADVLWYWYPKLLASPK